MSAKPEDIDLDINCTITLNGTEYSANTSETILDVSKRNGIEIPHLCFKEGMRPDGNCRVCVVEIGTAKKGIEKIRTVVAAPNSAANPRVGVMCVIFFPTVTITLAPHVITPKVIPALPNKINHVGIGASD